jgi:hypothetical protein
MLPGRPSPRPHGSRNARRLERGRRETASECDQRESSSSSSSSMAEGGSKASSSSTEAALLADERSAPGGGAPRFEHAGAKRTTAKIRTNVDAEACMNFSESAHAAVVHGDMLQRRPRSTRRATSRSPLVQQTGSRNRGESTSSRAGCEPNAIAAHLPAQLLRRNRYHCDPSATACRGRLDAMSPLCRQRWVMTRAPPRGRSYFYADHA